ncbi:MAG: methyltransferase domain-containing protein [bacterium]
MEQELILLACPYCHGGLTENEEYLSCTNCSTGAKFPKVGRIYSFLESKEQDVDLSIAKWNQHYQNFDHDRIERELGKYLAEDYPFVRPQLFENGKLNKEMTFLEIGCGSMFLPSQLAHEVKLVVGMDFSLEALQLAQKLLDQKGVTNYLLIHGDIKYMPLSDCCVDLIYGGGVLEHFKDTSRAVSEMHRVLKSGGRTFNTVPYLNAGSLTYRQVWGNIPNLPVLRQFYEFIHVKLLKSKHMKFGYELSFSALSLKSLHRKAGFKKVKVSHFKTRLVFEYVQNKVLRKIMTWLAEESPLFWPMVKVEATK